MKYSKHNIQQKKQTKRGEKNLQLPFRVEVSKFTLEFSYSFSPQIAWHVKSETFLTVFDVISITCNFIKKIDKLQSPLTANQILLVGTLPNHIE